MAPKRARQARVPPTRHAQGTWHPDPDRVARSVESALSSLSVRELWSRSGPQFRHGHEAGYLYPSEVAPEMMEEAMSEHLLRADRLWERGHRRDALACVAGIVEGLAMWDEGGGGFHEEAVECAEDVARDFLRGWFKEARRHRGSTELLRQMVVSAVPDEFLAKVRLRGLKAGRAQ